VRKFAVGFPISRGVFASTFAAALLPPGKSIQWSYEPGARPPDPYAADTGAACPPAAIADFPRFAAYEGKVFVKFLPKPIRGGNAGLLVVVSIQDPEGGFREVVFFPKSFNGSGGMNVVRSDGAENFRGSFSALGSSEAGGEGQLQLWSFPLDFREMICYMLLEATGHGPPVTFFLDADVAGSLWILTRGVVGASGDAYALKFAAAPSQFCASAALAALWGLEDLNPTNFCCVDPAPDSQFPITFFDFVPELLKTSSTFRELDDLVKRVMESGVVPVAQSCSCPGSLAVDLGSAISVDFGAPLSLSFSGRFPVISAEGNAAPDVQVSLADAIQVKLPNAVGVEFTDSLQFILPDPVRFIVVDLIPEALSRAIPPVLRTFIPRLFQAVLPALLKLAIPRFLAVAFPALLQNGNSADGIAASVSAAGEAVSASVRSVSKEVDAVIWTETVRPTLADAVRALSKSDEERPPVSIEFVKDIPLRLQGPVSVNVSVNVPDGPVAALCVSAVQVLADPLNELLGSAIPVVLRFAVRQIVPLVIPLLLLAQTPSFSRDGILAAVKTTLDRLSPKSLTLQPRAIPLAVFPLAQELKLLPLIELLDSSKRAGGLSRRGRALSLLEFVWDLEDQIWAIFFKCPVHAFNNRTIGELFGFTDVDKLWDRDVFKDAVKRVTQPGGSGKFEDFLKAVWVTAEGLMKEKKRSYEIEKPPETIEQNPKAKFAVVAMRWFSVSLERRMASAQTLLRDAKPQ
jgi:hypothetical protein